jgi:hypothetical protein
MAQRLDYGYAAVASLGVEAKSYRAAAAATITHCVIEASHDGERHRSRRDCRRCCGSCQWIL